MKTFFSLVLILLLFTGCSVLQFSQKPNYFNSTTVEKLEHSLIADDLFNFIRTYYAPNKTTLYITTSDSNKMFYNTLIQKLRESGYAITADNSLKDLTFLSYNIKNDQNVFFVSYNINESRINRLYRIEDEKFVRVGAISSFNFTRTPLLDNTIVLTKASPKEDMPTPILKAEEIKAENPINTFTEETIKPSVVQVPKPNDQEKPKLGAKPTVAPKKGKIPTLVLKEQKPFKVPEDAKRIASQMPQKSTKTPLAIGEDGKPVETPKIESYKEKISSTADVHVSIIEQLENNTTIAPQEPQKEEKKPIEELVTSLNHVGDPMMHDQGVKEEVKPVETPKNESPAVVDTNTSADPKVIAALDKLKSEPSVIQEAIKSDTKIDINDTKVTKNDVNDTQIVKNDTKPAIETVVIKDRPFDPDPTPNDTPSKEKELTLVEILEEAIAVYPNFDKTKLREDMMREVVKSPWIDAEAVKSMPLSKGLLLQLLKVAKEKQ